MTSLDTESKGDSRPNVAGVVGEEEEACDVCRQKDSRCALCLLRRFQRDRVLTTELLSMQRHLLDLFNGPVGATLLADLADVSRAVDRLVADDGLRQLRASVSRGRAALGTAEDPRVRMLCAPIEGGSFMRLDFSEDPRSPSLTLHFEEGRTRLVDISATVVNVDALVRRALGGKLVVRSASVGISLALAKESP